MGEGTTLHIQQATYEMTGEYTCVVAVSTVPGMQVSGSVHIIVQGQSVLAGTVLLSPLHRESVSETVPLKTSAASSSCWTVLNLKHLCGKYLVSLTASQTIVRMSVYIKQRSNQHFWIPTTVIVCVQGILSWWEQRRRCTWRRLQAAWWTWAVRLGAILLPASPGTSLAARYSSLSTRIRKTVFSTYWPNNRNNLHTRPSVRLIIELTL